MNDGRRRLCICAFFVSGCVAALRTQAVQPVSAVQDGAGGAASGGVYRLVSSAAQPGGIRCSGDGLAGGRRHSAGFLGTFILQPGLDHDGNGVPDELNDDNDGDGLDDMAELTGSDFETAWGVAAATDLNEGDSDGDGSGDSHELHSGTNPNDADSYFAITGIQKEADSMRVSWRGRGAGSRYRVLYRDGSYEMPADLLEEIAVDVFEGAPWYTTDASVLDEDGADVRHYGLKKQ
jgi:hypothetical protein